MHVSKQLAWSRNAAAPFLLLALPLLFLFLRHGLYPNTIFFSAPDPAAENNPNIMNRQVLRHHDEVGTGVHFEIIHGQEAVWEAPQEPPRAITIFGHGCYHSGGDLWPPQPACPTRCIGLTEEIVWRRAMLARGHVVIGISSQDRVGRGCWFEVKKDKGASAAKVARTLIQRLQLSHLPTYAMGVSGGAFMAMTLPFAMPEIAGVYAQVRAFYEPEKDYILPNKRPYPPIVFVHMKHHDRDTAKLVTRSIKYLGKHGTPAAEIRVDPQPLTVEFLTARSEGLVDVEMAWKIVKILDEHGYIDKQTGKLIGNMRPVTKKWAPLLAPHINNMTLELDKSIIGELLNVAFARHEFVHDYADAVMEWLENNGKGGQDELNRLVEIEKEKDREEVARWKIEVRKAMDQLGMKHD